ncbi:MAG TPA: response regulator transcription factor [Myxococcales bacterium]|nr:response regulator transcription factor [Myxococcales bacterium]
MILIVEDSRTEAWFLEKGLEQVGYSLRVVTSLESARVAVQDPELTAVVVDRWLPDGDGLDLITLLRDSGNNIPAVVVTSMGALEKRLEGLRAGADDYISKPFSMEELVLRLNRLTQRKVDTAAIQIGALFMSPDGHQVKINGRSIILTATEFALAWLLASNPGRVYSAEQLLQEVWGIDHDPGSNRVAVYIRHLRSKLGDGLIHTIRNVGYLLDPNHK